MPAQTTATTDKQALILEAAFARFTAYGYRRTSMEDLAQEAGISRPALYTHFKNKEDIFRALARRIQVQATEGARAAAETPGSVETRVRGVLEAKLAVFFDIVQQSAHAAELLDENNRICGDITAEYQRKYLALLKRVIADGVAAGELDLTGVNVSAGIAAELIVAAAQGLETGTTGTATRSNYRRRLDQLVRVMVAGLSRRGPT